MKQISWIRYFTIAAFLVGAGLATVARMVYMQNSVSGAALVDNSKMYISPVIRQEPKRGSIYDRYGNLLAGVIQTYEIGVNLAADPDPETIAQEIQAVLPDVNRTRIIEQASIPFEEKKSVYAQLISHVSADKVAVLRAKRQDYIDNPRPAARGQRTPSLTALSFVPILDRSYPEGFLASNILGFYTYGNKQGNFGVEDFYNEILTGIARDVTLINDPTQAQDSTIVPPGADLILTIDRAIQASMEKILDKAVQDSGSASGVIIISDPNTGEILAMANSQRMDLNDWPNLDTKYFPADKWPKEERFNRFNQSIGINYEPGSVFKVLTMVSALDAGTVTPETTFNDTGVFLYRGGRVINWDSGAWGKQTMTGCMEHSLNVCLAWVASKLGPDQFYQYIQKFGIGQMTGIDLVGEVNYPLRLPGGNWEEFDLATNSFGQGLAVTPIQMVAAISAVANNQGKMMAPHVLKSYITNGHQYNIYPQVSGTPIKAESAKALSSMLAKSLEGESMSSAMVEGYRLAGKTGTAEIPVPNLGYTSALTNASFVGWGPVDDPRFLVYIWLEKPQSSKWGSVVAAPVFSEVVKKLVVLMNIPPDEVRLKMQNQIAADPQKGQ